VTTIDHQLVVGARVVVQVRGTVGPTGSREGSSQLAGGLSAAYILLTFLLTLAEKCRVFPADGMLCNQQVRGSSPFTGFSVPKRALSQGKARAFEDAVLVSLRTTWGPAAERLFRRNGPFSSFPSACRHRFRSSGGLL
jgi:hypothetical protein